MTKYTGPEFEHCDRCPKPASELVIFYVDRHEEALCFACWRPLADERKVKTLHWINRYGRLMFAPGATTGPFRIKHP